MVDIKNCLWEDEKLTLGSVLNINDQAVLINGPEPIQYTNFVIFFDALEM